MHVTKLCSFQEQNRALEQRESSDKVAEIQLCLNELIWRETWGTHSLEAYNNFLAHVSELTRIIENFKSQSTVHSVLQAIVANPYGHWKYSTLENYFTNKSIAPANHHVEVPQIISTQPESTEDVSSVSIVEPYYYGTYAGDEVTISEINYSISCHLCTEKFSKNDLFIEHLVKHLLNKTGYDKIQVCTVCLKSFSNKLKLANHITNYHKNKASETSCLICDEDFSYRFRLLEHMKNTHTELELPYRCGLCDFMCSEQKKLSGHFSSFHNESREIWCPVCFKIFNVVETKQDRRSYADLNNFTQHILRHLQKPFVKKCPKCAVHFIHDIAMEEHLRNNHGISMNKVGVVRYSGVITERDTRVVRDRTQTSGSSQINNSRTLKTIKKMYNATPTQETSIHVILPRFKCIDCEGALIYHKYNTRFNCKKCAYSSFCEQAMRYHTMDVHIKDFLKHSLLKYKDNTLSCSCGYFTNYSNKMAKHFSLCKFKLLEVCNENVLNNCIVSSVLLKKSVNMSQAKLKK
ncbi:hypothetical protein LSTR_LSTR010045 [Laodelphax striatellus]|uniref:C2H2-type domain-containing protein n=1 Tax=Laodelphax striatellus TaxID=195883 RepID=A0A482WN90_LAOST|nr:hypothetical protein LSTR_LSTR010045 [Laodelphax striatellus]